MKPVRVGIIGMQADRSWSAIAHLPALRSVPGFEVLAVANTRKESAEAAALRYDIPRAYAGHAALLADPDIDLVVVTVKVPAHLELVSAAIAAGKNVHCEWPLGNGLAEAQAMAALAAQAGVSATVSMQAHYAPPVAYLRDLIAEGFIGEVLSSTLIGSGMNWGTHVDQANAYTADRVFGATMLSIAIGHTMQAVCTTLGELSGISATMAARRGTTTVVETGEVIPMTTEDQIAFAGVFPNGAIFSAHYHGGMGPGTGLLWEIYGRNGTLRATAMGGNAQVMDLMIEGAAGAQAMLETMPVPEKYFHTDAQLNHARNVAELYVRLQSDLSEGTHLTPSFEDGVTRHMLLEEIIRAAQPKT